MERFYYPHLHLLSQGERRDKEKTIVMELKEYFQIIQKNLTLFLLTVVVVVAGVFLYFSLRPVSYSASLTLNITRAAVQRSNEYQFDNYYRLQADEKFAETIVQWLKSPRVVTDIYADAGVETGDFSLRRLSKMFKADKMSSQIVLVTLQAKSTEEAKKISSAVVKEAEENTEALNKDQKEETWFKIVANNPVIVRNGINSATLIIASLILGIFLAFWVALFSHYIRTS